MKPVVIAGYVRSPFTPARKGDLALVRPDDLAAEVVRGLIARTGVVPTDIEDLILGCAFPEGEQGFNLARLLVLMADLPISVAGTTVNRFCGSSMQSIHFAAGQIRLGPAATAGRCCRAAAKRISAKLKPIAFMRKPVIDFYASLRSVPKRSDEVQAICCSNRSIRSVARATAAASYAARCGLKKP
jgi:hypothetical protein